MYNLNEVLAQASVSSPPDSTKPFGLFVTISDVLTQGYPDREKPSAYASSILKGVKMYYAKPLLAV